MKKIQLLNQQVAIAFYGRFPTLRDVQEATIEPLINGRNVVISSGTGSGKTEAVVAPLMSRYWRFVSKSNSLLLLYIAPTKALVNDLEKRLQPPLGMLGLKIGVRHGDRDDLIGGSIPTLLITTPESLDVMLFRKDPALRSVRAVIIDEVHLLYNTQRGLQLSILMRRLRQVVSDDLQWAALSATIGNLLHIRDFLMGEAVDAEFFNFSTRRTIDAQVRYIQGDGDFLGLIRRLTHGRSTKVLVFANSRRECEKLTGVLQNEDALRESIFAHYSSLSPEVRLATERKFASMKTAICVATSTLEFGIDIGDIDVVLLWGPPGGVDSFLQRIGRGNRRANKSNVVCLVPTDSSDVALDALHFAALINAASIGELPVRAPYDLFGAFGQQCLSVIASDEGRFTRVADLRELVGHKSYFSRDFVESILAELASKDFLQRHGYKNRYGAEESLHRLVDLKLIYGNFGMGSQTVDIFHGSKRLGEVPVINLLKLRRGINVRFAGKTWLVQKTSREGIYLQPSRPASQSFDFAYGGDGLHTDSFVADHIWRMIHSMEFSDAIFAGDLKRQVLNFRERLRKFCSYEQIPFQRFMGGIRYFTFGGYQVNKAIGLISGKAEFEADGFSLIVPSPIDWNSVRREPAAYEDVFDSLFEISSAQSIYQQQLPEDLQLLEFLQDWLKDESIAPILERLSASTPVEVGELF
jgi:ATP-dependent helicase Lhr and Lhr-like helicase